jgi:hypothetical protein
LIPKKINQKKKKEKDDNGVKPMDIEKSIQKNDDQKVSSINNVNSKDITKEEKVDNKSTSNEEKKDTTGIKDQESKKEGTEKDNNITKNDKKNDKKNDIECEQKDIKENTTNPKPNISSLIPTSTSATNTSLSIANTTTTAPKLNTTTAATTITTTTINTTTETKKIISSSSSSIPENKIVEKEIVKDNEKIKDTNNKETKMDEVKSKNIITELVSVSNTNETNNEKIINEVEKEKSIKETKVLESPAKSKEILNNNLYHTPEKNIINLKSSEEKENNKDNVNAKTEEKKSPEKKNIKLVSKNNHSSTSTNDNISMQVDTEDSNSFSSSIMPLSAEPESLDEDKNDSDDQRKQALQEMKNIEIDFAKLRERIYLEKLEELNNEIEMIKNDTHPDLVESIKKIKAKKDERIKMAEAWKRHQLECIENHFRVYYKELDSTRQSKINTTRKELMNKIQSNRWKIYNDKRNFELTKIASESGYEPASKNKKRKISKNEINILKSLRMTGTSKNELHEDLEILKIKNRN